jgi:hypothetical protein
MILLKRRGRIRNEQLLQGRKDKSKFLELHTCYLQETDGKLTGGPNMKFQFSAKQQSAPTDFLIVHIQKFIHNFYEIFISV